MGRYQGWIGYRALVTEAGTGGTSQIVWVEYGADQTITLTAPQYGGQVGDSLFLPGAPKPINVPDGNYQVVSGDLARALIQSYQTLIGQTMKLDDGGVANVYQLLSRAAYQAGKYSAPDGTAITPPLLDPGTTDVLIRTPPALASSPGGLVVQEYPFQPAGASIPQNIQSILVNKDTGVIAMQSLGHISPLYDYFQAKAQGQSFWTCPGAPAQKGQPDNALQAGALQQQVTIQGGSSGATTTYTVDNTRVRFESCDSFSIQKLLGPVPGVYVDSGTRWQSPFSDAPQTDQYGHYALDYPYQAGFSLQDTVFFRFNFTQFDPRIKAGMQYFDRIQTYSGSEDVTQQLPAFNSYGGTAAVMWGGGYETDGDLASTPGFMSDPPLIPTQPPVRSINLPFDVAALVGTADVQNVLPIDDPSITLGANEIDGTIVLPIDENIPPGGSADKPGITKYTYTRPTYLPSQPLPASSASAPAPSVPPTSYVPDLKHHGLLMQIGRADLYQTDLYVYSDTGERIFQRSGLLPQEFEGVTCDDKGCTQAVAAEGHWDARFNFQTQIPIRDVTVGAQVRIILINRATGYIGTMWAPLNRAGAFPEIDIDPSHPIRMGPPNLKVHVLRNRSDNKKFTVGFEGDGLVEDQYIQIITEWYDADGSSLPADLPGYTGRLAKVDAQHNLVPANGAAAAPGSSATPASSATPSGSTPPGNSNIATFAIRPGSKTEVLRLPDPAKLLDHFYVHIQGTRSTELANGQSPTWDSTTGAQGGTAGSADNNALLLTRPAHYVPFRVPLYDRNAGPDGGIPDPCNCDEMHPAGYHWVYRPEMAFQLLDLVSLYWDSGNGNPVDVLNPTTKPGDLATNAAPGPVSGGSGVNLVYSVVGSAIPGLDPLGQPQELVIAIGDTEVRLQVFTDPNTGQVYFVSLDPTVLATLTPNDLAALRIYVESDQGNPLWSFGQYNQIQVSLLKQAGPLIPGQSVTLLANTDPPTMQLMWTATTESGGRPVQFALDAAPANGDGHADHRQILRIDPNSGSGTVVVRAVDVKSKLFFGETRLEVGDASDPSDLGVNVHISLGKTVGGGSAGALLIQQSGNPDATLATAGKLVLATPSDQVVATHDDFGHIQHVTAPQVFVDVLKVTGCQYTVKVYAREDLPDDPGNGCAPSNASPKEVWTITNPAGCPNDTATDFSQLEVKEDVDNRTLKRKYLHAGNTWTLTEGDGSGTRVTVIQEVKQNENKRTVTRTISGSGSTVSQVATVYERPFNTQTLTDPKKQIAAGNEVPTSETRKTGLAGGALTTTWTYFTDSTKGSWQKIEKQTNPDTSYVTYSYDDTTGLLTDEQRNWAGGGIHEFQYDATPSGDDANPPSKVAEPRSIRELIGSNLLAQTTRTFTQTGNQLKESVDTLIVAGGRTLHSEKLFDTIDIKAVTPAGPLDGRLKREVMQNGQTANYNYAAGGCLGRKIGQGNVTACDVITTIDRGQAGASGGDQPVTEDVETEDAFGNVKSISASVAGTTGYTPAVTETRTIGPNNHVKQVIAGGGTGKSADWGWRFLNSETDDKGLKTSYDQYDGLGRVTQTTSAGPGGAVTTTYIYDAASHVVDQNVQAPNAEPQETRRTFDWVGRVIEFTSPGSGTTKTKFDDTALTQTVTFPASEAGPIGEVTTLATDGQPLIIDPQGAGLARYFSYGSMGGGKKTITEFMGDAQSPMKRVTVLDGADKVIEIDQQGYDDGSGAITTEVTTFVYDNFDRLVKRVDPGRAPTLYQYDATGHLAATGMDVDKDNNLSAGVDRFVQLGFSFTFDGALWEEKTATVFDTAENGSSIGVVAARRRQRVDTNDSVRSQLQETDAAGATVTTTTTFTGAGRTTQTAVFPDGSQEVTQYLAGVEQSFTNRSGITVTFQSDGIGRRTGITDPRSGQTTISYDGTTGKVKTIQDGQGRTEQFAYEDGAHRLKSVTHSSGLTTTYQYDLWGHVILQSGSSELPVQWVYDTEFGWLTQVGTARSDGQFDLTTFNHDNATGLVNSRTDPAGKTVTFTYGTSGRLRTRTWARTGGGGGSGSFDAKYGYDPATGELLTVAYGGSSAQTPPVTFTYDTLGRMDTVTDVLGQRQFKYNAVLRLQDEIFANGATIHHDYEDGTNSSIPGRIAGVSMPVTSQPGPAYNVTYHYEPKTGRAHDVQWKDGGGTSGSDTATYAYWPNTDLLQTVVFGSGPQVAIGYVSNGYQPNSFETDVAGKQISQYTHDYDSLDRMKSVVRTGTAFAQTGNTYDLLSYDNADELAGSDTYAGALQRDAKGGIVTPNAGALAQRARSYHYDTAGNRTTTVEGPIDPMSSQTTSWTYSPNALNGYDKRTAGATTDQFGYDNDGNMLSAPMNGKPTTYTYDGENRVTSAQPTNPVDNDQRVEFAYDYLNRRVRKVEYSFGGGKWSLTATTSFYYDGQNMIREVRQPPPGTTPATTTVRDYVWGLSRAGGLLASIQAGSERVYAHDTLGSVAQVLNPTDGSIVAQYEYDAYGNTISSDGPEAETQPFRWKSKYVDALSGTYSFGAIDYVPTLGRWLSRGNDVNQYRFAQNAPPDIDEPMRNASYADGLLALLGTATEFLSPGESLLTASRRYASDERHLVQDKVRMARKQEATLSGILTAVYNGVERSVVTVAILAVVVTVAVIVAPEVTLPILAALGEEATALTYLGVGMAVYDGASAYADYQSGSIGAEELAERWSEGVSSFVVPFAIGRAGRVVGRLAAEASELRSATRVARAREPSWARVLFEVGEEGGEGANGFRRECPGGSCEGGRGSCFTAGTLVATPAGKQAIESLRVGDRVNTNDDDGSGATGIDPATWRDVRLHMPNPDGSRDVIDVEILRPLSWIANAGASPGAWIAFGLPEMGLYGPAVVESITSVPPIKSGPGRVVRATLTHVNTEVHVLTFRENEDVLEPTATHRLFSIDRQGWVSAADLREGERLAARTGPVTIATNQEKSRAERVYNIEVETEHDYLVGDHGVLSHNESPCTPNEVMRTWAQQGGYVDPITNQWVATQETLAADHVYPKSLIVRLRGFDKLSRAQKDFLLNYPGNFEPLPRNWNSSKLNRLAADWATTPMGSQAHPEYLRRLDARQQAFKSFAEDMIAFWGK
jgi:RHS repeat-associated protein